jgi:hypothetical protein
LTTKRKEETVKKETEKKQWFKGLTPSKTIIISLIFTFFAFVIFMCLDKVYSGIIIYGVAAAAIIVGCGVIASILLMLKNS